MGDEHTRLCWPDMQQAMILQRPATINGKTGVVVTHQQLPRNGFSLGDLHTLKLAHAKVHTDV